MSEIMQTQKIIDRYEEEKEILLAKLKSKYTEGYMDGKAFANRHITIRDHFAGLAMQTLPKDMGDMETLARLSYNMADAMLAERNKDDQED